jgi:hypothetical protein
MSITAAASWYFGVELGYADVMQPVLIHGFDGSEFLDVFVAHKAIDQYFRRRDLTGRQRELLVKSNLDKLDPVILRKYDAGEISDCVEIDGLRRTQIDLSLADLEKAPEKLSEDVLNTGASGGVPSPSASAVGHRNHLRWRFYRRAK